MHRIICHNAKRNGTQYTLTILPHFLLPGCLVRADDVFTAGMDKEIRKDIDKSCETMGVKDDRTAQKHLHRFDSCLDDNVKRLAQIVSESGERLPEIKPGYGTLSDINTTWFDALGSSVISIREKLFGFENLSQQDIEGLSVFFDNSSYPCASINKHTRSITFQAWHYFPLPGGKSPPPNDVMTGHQDHVKLLIERRET